MKKFALLVIILVLSITVLPIHGQDEGMSCSADEFSESASLLADSFDEFTSLLDEMPDEPTAADLTAGVAVVDAYATGFWEGFNEALDEGMCDEVVWLGYTSGLALDELLITTQLAALALYEAEAGNSDLAETLAAFAEDRAVSLDESITSIGEIMDAIADGAEVLDVEFVECTDDELAAIDEGLDEIAAVYEELGTLAEEAEGAELSALIVGYAELSASYWSEFMPEVPYCLDAQTVTYLAGLLIDESLISVSLLQLSELEAEFGDADVAVALAESANARIEEILLILEEME